MSTNTRVRQMNALIKLMETSKDEAVIIAASRELNALRIAGPARKGAKTKAEKIEDSARDLLGISR